jgi:hypothetical protein
MDQAPKIENEVVERELSSEEKKTLADAWFNLVLGRKNDSTDVEGFNNEQMRAWLYDSLISETLVLRNEWNINPDIEKYQEALDAVDKEDFTKKGNVQFRFIDFLNDKIVDFDTSHPEGLGRPRRLESWPKTMRESKNFNCVGATLFAIASLEEAGIDCFSGAPAGHSVAIARLADGEYVYVDLNNDKVSVIHPEEKNIGGVRCLVLKDPSIDYEIVPIFDRDEIVEAVLGNLSGVPSDVKKGVHESEEQERRTKAIYLSDKESFDKIDFLGFKNSLYGPDRDPWNQNKDPAFEVEFQKVYLLRELTFFFKKISPETKKALMGIFLSNLEEVKMLMRDINSATIPGASAEVIQILKNLHEFAWQKTHGNEAAIIKAIDHLYFKMKGSKDYSTSS